MKRYRLTQLDDVRAGHFLRGLVPGKYLNKGGMSFKKPGERSHGDEERHVHEDCEIFVILQGRGTLEVEGVEHALTTGDVAIVEPGESHHLSADEDDPCVNLWLHAADARPGAAS